MESFNREAINILMQSLTELGQLDIRVEGLNAVQSEQDFKNRVFVDPSSPAITWAEVQAKMDELRPQKALKKLREQRDEKLKQTDQYGLADYPFRSDEHKQAWQDYRQQLRDLPANSPEAQIDLETGELTGVVWPTKPTN